MAKQAAERQIEAKNHIKKRTQPEKNSYIMARTVRYNGIVYEKGKQVEFTDKNIEQKFLQNNYIV